jgi:(p)ppGpp synthase/HD superfamily hydrolase
MSNFIEKYGFDPNHAQLIKKAIIAATKGHNDTNHMYGNASYTIHLSHVVDVAYRFIHLVPINLRPIIIAACWLHDSVEDARLSYNDILKIFKDEPSDVAVMIAEIVRAVTNYTRGRNRDERMPNFIYHEIRDTEGATFVKFCDRIANIEFKGKSDMYEKEHQHFSSMLWNGKYEEMLEYMEYLFEINKKNLINIEKS